MISKSFTCNSINKTKLPGERASFFNFKQLLLVSAPCSAHDQTPNAMKPGALSCCDEVSPTNRLVAPGTWRTTYFKKRHMLWVLLVLIMMHLSHLMAKNDEHRSSWTPPIEPPGSVIVTSLSEGSASFRIANKASDVPLNRVAVSASASTPSRPPEQIHGHEAALRQAIQQWSQAWSGLDITQYLGMYASDFAPSKGLSRVEWDHQRTQRITRKKSIQHSIQNLSVQINANQATVRFMQIYQDEKMRATDSKNMQWVLRNGQWKITRESTD